MGIRDKMVRLDGCPGVFVIRHDSRKHGIRFDRQFVLRQTLGGKTRISALGWESEGFKQGDALNKLSEYAANFKWNRANPDRPAKPLCREDEKRLEEAAAAELEAERAVKENRPTFLSLWEDYSQTLNRSLRTDKTNFKKHLKDIHGKTPDELVPLDIDRIKNRMERAKYKPQTINHVLTLISRLVNHGLGQGRCKPLNFRIKRKKFNNKVTESLSEEQAQSLLAAIDADLERDPYTGRAMLLVLATGIRRGALLRLQWKDIDFERENIHLRDAKSKEEDKSYYIPLNLAAKTVLAEIPRTDSPYVFPGKNGKKRADFDKPSRRIRKAAGLPETFRPFHGLRHHYASELVSQDDAVNIYTLQKLLNHADVSTTQRYAEISDKKLKAAAEKANFIGLRVVK